METGREEQSATVAERGAGADEAPELSIVVPLYDEAANLRPLHEALREALDPEGWRWEAVYVDDGSDDGSFEELRALSAEDARVRAVRLRRNFGQTAAMNAGFDHVRGRVVVPMDADLQNDPADIGALVAKLDEGYDVVSGWRAERKDAFWSVTLPSRIGNALIGRVTGVRLHDYGCTLSAYRREIVGELELYGEMHRYIPAWAASLGARITELPVRHHPRRRGRSKYGPGKALRVLLDLITVRFFLAHGTHPLYFFGRLGLAVGAGAGLCWSWTVVKKAVWGRPLYTDPFFMAGIFLALAGLQIVLVGLVAELTMRTYYESQGKRIYLVRERLNVDAEAGTARRTGADRG